MLITKWPLQEEANGDADGGAAAAAASAASASAGGGDKGGEKKGEPSLLAQGADAAAQAAAAASAASAKAAEDAKLKADPNAWLPERFRVFDGDGDAKKLNQEASAKKVVGAYAELEKRMKDTGLPPASDTEYKFTPPKGKEKLAMDAAGEATTKKAMHGLGLTQKQYQGVMELYVNAIGDMAERGLQMGAENAAKALEHVWGPQNEPKFKANLALAHKAFTAFADEGDLAKIDEIGNNPIYLRVLAKIGRELREDTGVGADVLQSKENIEALMKDPAYFDEKNPRHAEVKGKVTRHFQAQAAAASRVAS